MVLSLILVEPETWGVERIGGKLEAALETAATGRGRQCHGVQLNGFKRAVGRPSCFPTPPLCPPAGKGRLLEPKEYGTPDKDPQ